tara:strand:- start:1278 stop:1625 length:348 start_codon:yes stop_codon:yes gene_type:complete
MPTATRMKRLLIDTLAAKTFEMVFGFDGSFATPDDGGAGRPAKTITPTVTVLDDTALLLEGNLGAEFSYDEEIREVYVQIKESDGTFTPVGRYAIRPFSKQNSNQVNIQVVIEVA